MAANRDAFEPAVALALANLCNQLLACGQHDRALATAEEAVRISRRLAQTNPASYQHRQARSVGKLAVTLAALGRSGEALHSANEALTIMQALAMANPIRYQPDLAEVLNNLRTILADQDQPRLAVAVTELAVQVLRPAGPSQPRPV